MNISKPNDIMVALVNNPTATTYDLKTLNINPDNTSLFSKDEYKNSEYIKKIFTENNKFNEVAFNNFYERAAKQYMELSDEAYLKELEKVEFSPFDETRPIDSNVYNINLEYSKEKNPFQQVYGRRSLDSVEDSPLSLREIAQQGKIYDTKNNKWLDESANDRKLLGKFFEETLVYAQWDDEGEHQDPITGYKVKHNKGDWKINQDGALYVETIGDREIYGKQVLNPLDVLTIDGSIANKFDFFDNDNKESSITKATIRMAAEIAPLLIPWGVGQAYAGVKAAVSLAAVMPTFYKAVEGLLLGDSKDYSKEWSTAAENYMAKFSAQSTSDEATGKIFSYEGMTQMVSDIFSQIYEQRAAASLSQIITKTKGLKFDAKQQEYLNRINKDLIDNVLTGKIDKDKAIELSKRAMEKIPELASFKRAQSKLAKSLSLGYMALTSTGEIYGQALESGYDRRTAGFASLAAAGGQYAIMMNNRLGDWFLDETTGYNQHVNRALINKTVKNYLKEVDEGFKTFRASPTKGKEALGVTFKKMQNSIKDIFSNPTVLGEELMKNAFIEGVEEVTEEVVLDATKGMVDVMSYLGLTAKKGSFNTVENVFSAQGAERYLASLLGGLLGGAMFEFHRTKLEPWINGKPLPQNLEKDLYEIIANGHTDLLINEVNKQRSRLGNDYITPIPGEYDNLASEKGHSQADVIADVTINKIKLLDGIINSRGLAVTDEEIIKKTILDDLVIEDLRKARGDNKIGIEGIILEDFKETAVKMVEIGSKLKTVEEGSKEEKDLKEELSILEKKSSDILEGKKSMDYFNQISLFFNPSVAKDYIITDKITYTKEVYGKDYYTLPEEGEGLTKKTIKEEFKEFIDSTDIRKKLRLATNYFLTIEKDFNKSLVDYTETNYAEHRKLVKDKIKSLSEIGLSISKADPETQEQLISYYAVLAQEIEELTGKRILPWESIKVDLNNQIKEKYLKSSSTKSINAQLNESIDENTTKNDVLDGIINNIINTLPTEQLNFSIISRYVNIGIQEYNNKIADKIKELQQSEETLSEETLKEIENLEKEFIELNVGLNISELEEFIILPEKGKSYLDEIIENGQTKGDFIKSLLDITQREDLKSWEQLENSFNEKLKVYNTELENKIDELRNSENSESPEVKDQIKLLEDNKINITLKTNNKNPFFTFKNYAIPTILELIKQGNLDKELLTYINTEVDSILSPIKAKLRNIVVSDKELLDFLMDFEKNMELPITIMSEYFEGYLGEELKEETLKDLPKWLQIKDSEEFIRVATLFNISRDDISELPFDSLKELKGVLDNSSNYISNSIYDYLENFELYLNNSDKKRTKSIFKILKDEELSLFKASGISFYLSEDVRDQDIVQALGVIKLFKGLVKSAKTTEVSINDPYGFLIARQNFARRNKIEDDVLNLKPITSDIAELAEKDLESLEEKLIFLRTLAKSNSSKTVVEDNILEEKATNLLLPEFTKINNFKLKYKDREIIPDLTSILSSTSSPAKKIVEIKDAIFLHNKELSNEGKLNAFKYLLSEKFDFINQLEKIDKLNKDTNTLSQHFIVSQLASAFSISSKDFINKQRNLLKTEFNAVPFYSQMLASEITYASIVNPEIFKLISNMFAIEETHITDYISYVLGGAGTGKSSVIFRSVLNMLKDSNPTLNVWFSAPNSDRVDALYDAVKPEIKDTMSTSLLSKKELFERLGVYDHWDKLKKDIPKLSRENVKFEYTFEEFTNIPNDLPDLIFIDEITHFNALELKLLNDVIASVSESGRNIRIIGAGDLAQKGATVQSISYNVERVSGTFSPILSITLRSSNVQKRVNNDTLEGIVNYAIANYETSKDTKKIVEFIKDKLSFRYYKDANIINGDLIVNSLNKELLSILASNPEKKIGVLLTEDQEATFRNLAEQVGINTNQVKYFTPDNIQGSESDYFIFNTKNINEEAITHKLKSFYTYMSRSKDATIIIDDFKINDLNYRNAEPDSSPEYIQPLTGEIIQDSKNKKLQKLTEIVDPNLNILYDFVFNAPTNIEGEFPVQTEVVETIISDTANKEEEIIPEDNMKFIYHSFYNDLNVKVTDLGDSVILRKSNQINSGLNILFKEGENEIEISKEEFNNFSKELILLKYEILGNIKNTKDNYIPSGNELLKKFLGEKYRVNSLSQKLVIKKTIYNKDYNAPFEKFGDKASEHLESGDEFVNIYLKITKDSKNYYIQIATAPKIQTIVDYFSNNDLISKKYPKWKDNITSYQSFLNSFENEALFDESLLQFNTSTRLVQNDEKQKLSLAELSNISGLLFWDLTDSIKPGNINSYSIMPNNFDRFKEIFLKTDLGKSLSEEELKDRFNKYKNRPYIAVSFLNNKDDIKILMLKRGTRNIKTAIESAIEAKNAIIKSNKKAINSDNIISAPQVLNMLVDLAVNKPNLFKSLFSEEFLKNPEQPFNHEVIEQYFHGLNSALKKDIIGHIAYEKEGEKTSTLRKVIEDILEKINNGESDPTEIKSSIVSIIRKRKDVLWARKFWNIFTLSSTLESVIQKPTIDQTLKDRYIELQNILNSIFKYWEDVEIYHDIAIKGLQDNGDFIINRNSEDLKYLYTDVVPEGPRLLIDFSNMDIVEEITNIEEEEDVNPFIEEEEIQEEIQEEIPTIDSYFTLVRDSNTLVINKFKELYNFLEQDPTSEEDLENQELIKKNWSKLYELLNSNVSYNLLDGSVQTIKFKDIEENIWNLFPENKLKLSPKLNNLINTNNWMGTVQLELLLENILELNNPDIWNC